MRKALLGVALGLWLAPPADASRLVYASNWAGPSQIYSVDAAGRRAQLTFGVPESCLVRPTSCGYSDPTASPDGRRVAFFESHSYCDARLYVAEASGDNRRLVARTTACGSLPAVVWAPKSRRFAYALGNAIYVVNADGRDSRLVATGSQPGWSPDGRSLAYVTPGSQGRPGSLAVRTGSRVRTLTADVGSFAWSPNGRWIAFERRVHIPFSARIELLRPNGTGGRVLADTYGNILDWSRDSRFIALAGGDGIEVIEVATGNRRMLGGFYGIEHPWSPAGPWLAFDGEKGVQLYDAAAGTSRVVSAEHTRDIVWSPGGRSFAYTARTFTTGYNQGGDLRIATLRGAPRTVVAAGGDYGGVISGVSWTMSPEGVRYRAPVKRVVARTAPNELVAPWEIGRLAADGKRIAYVSCGHVFVWSPSTNQVRQAEAIASLAPRCPTPRDYVAFQIYGLALDGDRIAYAHVDGNMGQTWSLDAGALGPTPSFAQLEIRYGASGCTEGDRGLGSPVGGGGVLVFSTWHDIVSTGCVGPVIKQAIHRIDSASCPCPVIASSPGPFVPFDADAGRVLAGGENSTLLLDRDGRQLQSIQVSPLAAQVSGQDIVIVTGGSLRHYDAGTGTLVHTWPLPAVSSGGECGRPHGRGWECVWPRLLLQDAADGLVAYVLDGNVHLLRLADGAGAVIAAGSRARFIDSGLVYANGARLRHVPFAELPVRGF